MSIRLTQVELQSEEDTVIFLASGHLNCSSLFWRRKTFWRTTMGRTLKFP